MIQIDKTYDVILTHSPIYEITGHIFECFDYYLFLRQFYKVGIIFFDGLDIERLKTAFESKYGVEFDSIRGDIIFIKLDPNNKSYMTISFGNKTTVILTDGHIKSLNHRKIILATKRLFGFLCEYDEFEKCTFNKNITYLADYRIYGKPRFFNSVDYVKKIPFKFYKKISHCRNNVGMMYTTFVCRKVSADIIQQSHDMSGCKQSILVVPYKTNEYSFLRDIKQVVAPVQNFMEQFDTYIYTPVSRHFDCSPRLMTECFLYGKKVIPNISYADDVGFNVRYNDCINNIQSLILSNNDAILDIIKNI